ncbi:MAG: cupin [Deltaproteobacteria bacterium]|nr:cupin [Deltaproteobacteria bacterium]
MSPTKLTLTSDAVHLDAALACKVIPAFNHDYARYITEHCTDADPGRLITLCESTSDWTHWETHPLGDELVLVTKGRAEFIQDVGGTYHRVIVGPNEAVINRAGVPHTANVIEPFTALYITPGPGTTHTPRSEKPV